MSDDDNVTYLNQPTRLKIPVERVIKRASEAEMQDVIIIGWDKDGELYFASSEPDGGTVLWLIELAKKKLLELGG